mgnify:FL=1
MKIEESYIVMPVKDAVESAERSIRAIVDSGHTLTVYDDYSTPENCEHLRQLSEELSFSLIHLSDVVDHPSPNYRTVLIDARERALTNHQSLIIIESDVEVKPQTIADLQALVAPQIGMVASVTENEAGEVNFPYEYAKDWRKEVIDTKKRFSFCCTLLTEELLQAIDFEQVLDEKKNWYDVTLSHLSLKKGFRHLLRMDSSVIHRPHASRPWKQLKYEHPLRYYWRKLTQHLDRI